MAVINIKRALRALTKTEPVAGNQEVTNRAFITGMFADAVKEITRVMHWIFRLQKYFGNSPSKNGTV
jgi:hypothetical protein